MKGGTLQINWHDTKPVLTLDFHPISGILATAGADYDIKLWLIASEEGEKKVPSSTYQNSLSYHGSAVNAIRFSPSGEFLASGADGGELIIWKLHNTDSGQVWKVLKTLSFHRKDVLDLEWSTDGAFLISGSVDNSCIIWDVNKGSVHQILDGHFHYVQGVAWDPLNKYTASLSSDRTCRIYLNKPQNKTKGSEKLNYVCQHVLNKVEPQVVEESKSAKHHIFHDETLPSFFRRLSWSPDGSFLLVPAGSYKLSPTSEPVNTAYVLSRKDLSRPALMLPGASKAVVAVRFCPKAFSLRGLGTSSSFKLPYRLVFAIATLNSLYVYDTEGIEPIAVLAGLHYAAITDIAWSPTAKFLALSSQDGYCTLVEFENDELGVPVSLSGDEQVPANANTITVEHERSKETKKDDETVKNADIQEMETDEKKGEISLRNSTEKQDVKQPSPSPVLPSKPTKKEDESVKNAGIQEMETDEKKGESSLVNLTEQQDVKSPPSSTVLPSKPAKRRITPMAID